ncbi:MAG: carbon-nitrogen hydrolase family protein [marine benthic group bacterium]|nr:carbon-nitrogen hydrolase family protein [Candidatus Benthicola marisminoris]
MSYLAGVIQMCSSADPESNWAAVEGLAREAAAAGASFISTPENALFLGPDVEKASRAERLSGPTCKRFARLADELEVYLLLGSFAERSDDPDRCFNTSVLFGPDGGVVATYRKIHLFDVDVSDEVRFRESDTVRPGSGISVATTDLGTFGLSVCFDLRFSGLYARLREAGAELITVPSAFTATTGRDHWHVLLRARAIETQSYVLAPAQMGRHDGSGLRESYGHSLIVDPWGEVLADAETGVGYAVAEIDLERVAEVRKAIPMRSAVTTEA